MSSERIKDILEAAGKCFVRYGYDKTTLDDIAEQVGINKASFYYYFRNKEAIFTELITREADEFIESTAEKVGSVNGCRARVLAWIRESFAYGKTNSILNRLSIESIRKLTPQLTGLKEYSKEKGTEYLYSILSEGREKGEISTDNILKTAQAIQNVVYAMKEQAYRDSGFDADGNIDIDRVVDEIVYAVSLILDGIAAV